MASLITADPQILGGKPIIRGTRISVDFILELFAAAASREEILMDYPHLSPESISAALLLRLMPSRTKFISNSRLPDEIYRH